jgi:hypothetical protein
LQLIFGRFKQKNQNLKKSCRRGTALRACRRAARRQVPGAVLAALAQEFDSCRRSPRRQGLNAVGCGDRSLTTWVTASDVHLSKILIQPIIFRKSCEI